MTAPSKVNSSAFEFRTPTFSESVSALTLLGAASLIVSFCFEFGFFVKVGFDYFPILTSTDYIHNALIFLGFSFTASALGFWAFVSFDTTLQKQITKYRDSEEKKMIERAGQLSMLKKIGSSALVILLISGAFVYEWFYSTLALLFIFIICVFIMIGLKKIHHNIRLFAAVSIIIMGGSYVLGLNSGETALFRNEERFKLTSTIYENGKDITLLRFVDKGVLYLLRDENRIEFSPWNQVKSVVGNADRKPDKTLKAILFDP